MSFSQSADSKKVIRLQRPAGSTLVVKWPVLISILQSLARAMGGYQLQIDGVDSMRTDVNGAIQAKINSSGGAVPAATHPFKVAHVSSNNFSVQGGTCEGITITTQTINVGSTRPVAILAWPKYTLGIDSGVFVNTMAVKSGTDAPTLVSSTSTLSDVDSGISSAGTEARALIALIDTGDVITQITRGNILGTWDDAGLTGKAAGHFNKNA